MQNHYLTTKEAADYLGLSASYLAKLRMRGSTVQGPNYTKIGFRAVRYSISDLDNWMKSRSIERSKPGCASYG